MKSYTDHELKIFLDPLPEECIKFMQDNFNISSAHELTAETAEDLVAELCMINELSCIGKFILVSNKNLDVSEIRGCRKHVEKLLIYH